MTDTRRKTKHHGGSRRPWPPAHLAPVPGTQGRVWLRPTMGCLVCLQPVVQWPHPDGPWHHVGGEGAEHEPVPTELVYSAPASEVVA